MLQLEKSEGFWYGAQPLDVLAKLWFVSVLFSEKEYVIL